MEECATVGALAGRRDYKVIWGEEALRTTRKGKRKCKSSERGMHEGRDWKNVAGDLGSKFGTAGGNQSERWMQRETDKGGKERRCWVWFREQRGWDGGKRREKKRQRRSNGTFRKKSEKWEKPVTRSMRDEGMKRRWRLSEGERWEGSRGREKERKWVVWDLGVYMEERVPKKSILSLSACSRKPSP